MAETGRVPKTVAFTDVVLIWRVRPLKYLSCRRLNLRPISLQFHLKWLQEEYERRMQEDPEEATLPYHYGSHYSNSGTVLHFLVRMPPFTKMFLMYQGMCSSTS